MRYVSTRGESPPIGFAEAVLAGLAPDGGLYVPETVPDLRAELEDWAGLDYRELAFEIMRRFCDVEPEALRALIDEACADFAIPEVVRTVPVGELHVLELFHGPTLAFKDIALQFLGRLFERLLARAGRDLNILAATSGDTGSAAIAGVRGRPGIRIFVLYPRGRISPLQERQMTTVLDANVHNLAVEGTFDDCQRMLKGLLRDTALKDRLRLGAVNSVNWARILAQIVYYVHAAFEVRRRTGGPRVRFAVPTGNFGDILAGWYAQRMGLPIARLVLATNDNDILARFFRTGRYASGPVARTLSPSMDIQAASNFERYLHARFGGDPAAVRAAMATFEREGALRVPPGPDGAVDPLFTAGTADTEATLAEIRRCVEDDGYCPDPHTAVGLAVARRRLDPDEPTIALATAHPAKFPEAVARATEAPPPRHPTLERLHGMPTRATAVPADIGAVRDYLEAHIPAEGAAAQGGGP